MTGLGHTSYDEQQDFLALSPAQQNLKIYLNGRETNGNVAEALRRIGKLEEARISDQQRADLHDARLGRLETRYAVAAGVLAAILTGAPILFWGLGQLIN